PEINPTGVQGAGTQKNNMEITWTPLNATQAYGPNLRYIVRWRRRDPRGSWYNETVKAPRHVVWNTPIYVPYEIKVQAENDFGRAPEPETYIGYSGEDSSCHACFLKAYFWRDSSLLKNLWVSKKRQYVSFPGDRNRGIVSRLFPYSNYKLEMVVTNGRGDGPRSEVKEFPTPEGGMLSCMFFLLSPFFLLPSSSQVPSSPRYLRIRQPNLESINLEWDHPEHPNGVLTGYNLRYQASEATTACLSSPVNGSKTGRTLVENFSPNQTRFTVQRTDPISRYRFFLRARTQVGDGEVIVEESPALLNEGECRAAPGIGLEAMIKALAKKCSHANPRYRTSGGGNKTEKSIPVKAQTPSSVQLANLTPGMVYKLWVFPIWSSPSEHSYITFTTSSAYTKNHVDIATQGWFIGLMCAIALLVLILLIVCFIKRSRGGKYPVRDNKDEHLNPEDKNVEDGSFDYSDEDNKPLPNSQTSLDGTIKQQESDDSLVDYGEGGEGQFNEDGSFIGQYTVKKDKEETEGNESSEATSPVNAIYSLA
ncbi:hypothetical protein CIB84_002231, partial [Bambusicola thoracicus]